MVLLETVHPDALDILSAAGEVVLVSDPPELDHDIPLDRVRGLVTRGAGRVTASTLDSLPTLEVVARCGAGLDNIDTAAALDAGVAVVHAPGSTTHAVAEHAVMLMLSLARRLVDLGNATSHGNWSVRDGYEGVELRGRRLGVIGLGAIGTRVAEIGRALDMDVVGWARNTRLPDVPILGLEELLATCDVIQICVALVPETTALIGPEELSIIKAGAMLINCARGPIVDHEALATALESGSLAGYAADVWATEPPDISDPLLGDPRVLLTPHVAGLTDRTYREICIRAATAAVAVLNGTEPDPSCVFGGPS